MKYVRINDLINNLTVFIRENRKRVNGLQTNETQANLRENDSF